MIRNVAGQSASCQMTATADGSDYAGVVTVYVTVDNGIQAVGTVGAGVCTNEGHGLYSYQPSQAETNGASIDFTFTGAGALTKTRNYQTLTAAQAAAAGTVTPTGNLVSDLLDTMAVLDNELDVGVGGDDENRAIKALSLAQHQMESIAATLPRVFQSTITVATVAGVETTTWTSSLVRLDAIWLLNSDGFPIRKLKKVFEVGGHVPALPWPLDLALPTGSGTPSGYYASPQSFYWLPLPSGVSSLRVYGLVEQAEFGARADAFNYQKRCKMPLASFAVKILNNAVGDATKNFDELAQQTFGPLLRSLRKLDRSEPTPRYYSDVHDT